MLLMVLNSLLKLDKLLASFSHRSILFWPEQFSKGQVARRSDAIKHAMQFTNCDMNAKLSMSIVRRCRSMANVQIVEEGGGLMPPVQNAST